MAYLVGFIITLTLLWGGGQGLYVWVSNPEPTTMTCAEYMREKPDAEWLRLSGCRIAGDSLAFAEGERNSEVYAPVRPAGAQLASTAELVTFIDDEAVIKRLHMTPEAEEFRDAEIQGMVQFGIEKDDEIVNQLDNVLNVVNDPVVLVRGEKPNVVFSGIMFGIGLLFGVGLLSSLVMGDEKEPG